MSDSDSHSEMAPPPRPIKRLGLGLRAILQLAFAFICLIGICYLGYKNFTRVDLTKRKTFTLSEATQNLLLSDSMQDREIPVKLIAGVRRKSIHFARLQPLLEEYERISKGKIQIEFVSPSQDANRAAEIKNNYDTLLSDKLFERELLIIDARGTSEQSGINNLRYLPTSDLIVKRDDQNNQRKIVGFQDEELISSMIQSAIEGTPRRLYLIADKSDVSIGEPNSPAKILSETLERQNIFLDIIKISEIETIPADAEGVVIVAPQYDFETKEIAILEDYWNRNSSSIIAYLDPNPRTVNLRSFLRKKGVTPRDDRVLRTRNGRTEAQVMGTFTAGLGIHGSLENQAVMFEGRVSSLEVREDAQDLVSNGIRCFSIIQTASGFWGESSYREPKPKFDANSDEPGPLSLGAAVIRGNANADDTADNVSKMIVLSSADFLDPKRLGNEQLDFIKNSTHWLLGREELIGVGPRSIERRHLNLIGEEIKLLQNIIIVFIPAGIFLIAIFVWNTRRA